jgi:ComF family protein
MRADKSSSLKGLLAGILNSIGHLVWPACCLNCYKSIDGDDNIICRSCFDDLISLSGGQYCRRCGRDCSSYGQLDGFCPACQDEQFLFDGIARGGIYDGVLRDLILLFKNGKTEADNMLALLLRSSLQGSAFSQTIDYFVPVPLHWTRRLRRGYNQSLLLTKLITDSPGRSPAQPGGKTKISTDLVRIRKTKLQSGLSTAASRAKNVAGAFAVRRDHKLSGRTVCLVDDIKTTGATLNECSRTLKQAGVSKVYSLVLAVAGQDTR